MSSHSLLARAAYQTRFRIVKRLPRQIHDGVSVLLITWNRARFLTETMKALAETLPEQHELLVWDNASEDDTTKVLAEWQSSRLNLRVFRHTNNIGTSGYARLALEARYSYLMEMDDDILALPANWYERMTDAFRAFPDLGYLALDVVQDEFTNGAKPLPEHYHAETRHGITVEFGAAGGWAAMAPRDFYFEAGGFPFRPHKPFFSEDGFFNRSTQEHGRRSGILAGVKVYHATGPAWNQAFGYGKLLESKLTSPGAATNSGVTFTTSGARIPDLSLVQPYRVKPSTETPAG